jgi:hypothetical protein
MVHKIKQRVIMPNAVLGGAKMQAALAGYTKVSTTFIERLAMPLCRERIWVKGHSFTITAANDYGGAKIADVPNKNLLIAGHMMNLKGTISSPNVGTDLTLSLGSAVAAATPLASTAIDRMAAKTGVGAAQAFTAIGHTFDESSPALIFMDAAASLGLFLNGAAAVTSGTCTVAFTDGYVDVFYFDLDEPVALT